MSPPPPPPPPPPPFLSRSHDPSANPPPPPPPPPPSALKASQTSSSTPTPDATPTPPPLSSAAHDSSVLPKSSTPPSITTNTQTDSNPPSPSDVDHSLLVPSAPPLSPELHETHLAPRPAIMDSRSPIYSPTRRPRRAGTRLPTATMSEMEMELGIERHARDEFEEEFLARGSSDREGFIINQHLEQVDFRQLEDDEESLSDDAADPRRGEEVARKMNEDVLDNVDLRKPRQSTVRSNWRRIPSEVGCEGCEGCERLCGENRRLRRQLDELEFELASGVLHNPADGFDPPQLIKAVPAIPQIPVTMKNKKGWAARLRNPTSASISSRHKPSEKARLRSEVQALNVTTEYLWRKLNKAELELRDYRLKDLRNRMALNGNHHKITETPQPRPTANTRSADWEWE